MAGGSGYRSRMTMLAPNRYAGHRFPPEIISHAVWLYFRFPLTLILCAILSKSVSDLVHTVARRRASPVETGAIGRVTGRAVEFWWGFAEELSFWRGTPEPTVVGCAYVDVGSAGDEPVGAAQVDRHAHQQQLGAVAVKAAVADPAVPIGALHQTEQLLDLAADRVRSSTSARRAGGGGGAGGTSQHRRSRPRRGPRDGSGCRRQIANLSHRSPVGEIPPRQF
jgi:hypothetical protein